MHGDIRDRLTALALIEARERSTDACFLPGDEASPDCWPDERIGTPARVTTPEENSLGRVAFEIGLLLGLPLALAGILLLFAAH